MSEKIDYTLEQQLIDYNQMRLLFFRQGLDFTPLVNEDFDKLLNARYHKCNRIQKHIVYGLTHYKYAYFGTFTFNDINIIKCERTKRDMVKHCLKSNNIEYVLNKDFGEQNGREHYHIIAFCDYKIEDITKPERIKHKGRYKTIWTNIKDYHGGLSSFEPIGNKKDDIMALKKYINKLSNHCLKDSADNARLVYSFKAYEIDYFGRDYDFTGKIITDKIKKQKSHYNSIRNGVAYLQDKSLLGFELMY